MKCDTCDNEATVHEVMIKGGKKVEKHLCERCAVRAGMQPPPAATLGAQVVTQFVLAHGQAAGGAAAKGRKPGGATALTCGSCGLSFAQFRQSGLLGCPGCYQAFADSLKPLLARAHEGGTHHVGKAPPGAAGSAAAAMTTEAAGGRLGVGLAAAQEISHEEARRRQEELAARQARISTLQRRLAEAVMAEQYERAAQLRDELQLAQDEAERDQDTPDEADAGSADA